MWFWFALTFAFLSSLSTLVFKIILKRSDEYVTAWASSVFNLPVLALIIFFFYQIPKIDKFFIFGTAVAALLNVLAGILSFRAIRIADISLIAPISAFNPVFTTIISLFTLREIPSLKGVIGILTIVLGAYLLNLGSLKKGILTPFKKLFSNPGVLLALICMFIWAITPIFEKTAIIHTQPRVPPFASLVANSFLILALLPIMLKKSKNPLGKIKINIKGYLLTGVLGGIAAAAAFNAFNLSQLGSVTAIFKLSMLFNVFWGYLFLGEKEIKSRLLGSVVMFVGVLLLIL